MQAAIERRASRRFSLALPIRLKVPDDSGPTEEVAETRDVGFRGLYFLVSGNMEAGSELEIILTLPKEITLAGDLHIRCFGHILRVDKHDSRQGVAARIERFEFLPAPI